jgi:hypothetical protein
VTATEEAVDRLAAALADMAGRWSRGSLAELVSASGPFVLERAFVASWHAAGPAAAAWAGEQAAAWARAIVGWLHGRQQFLDVAEVTVAAAIRAAVGRAGVDGIEAAARGLRAEIAAPVRAQLGERPTEVVCSEYSPELQLRLLGLGLADVRGPVLDVGCGAAAALVATLRARGLAAEGIDRVRGDDWLRHAYGAERWATVVSHQAFSLHFLHHHLRAGPTAMAYAEVYMAILRSLGAGGVFAYAPGLPFIEGMLPRATYRVVRVPLPDAPALRALSAAAGFAVDHATQVWRA